MTVKAGSQNDARPCVALRRHALTLAATQPNARIDSNPIPAFPRVAFERQIEKNCANSIVSPLAKFNATQRKAFASTCEPAFSHCMCRYMNISQGIFMQGVLLRPLGLSFAPHRIFSTSSIVNYVVCTCPSPLKFWYLAFAPPPHPPTHPKQSPEINPA